MTKWISVKDRLPEKDKRVQTWNGYEQHVGWIRKYSGDNFGWEYSECCGCDIGDVTHWMPLPEPLNET